MHGVLGHFTGNNCMCAYCVFSHLCLNKKKKSYRKNCASALAPFFLNEIPIPYYGIKLRMLRNPYIFLFIRATSIQRQQKHKKTKM